MSKILLFALTALALTSHQSECARRIGKLNSQTWQTHLEFGENEGVFSLSSEYPDFDSVGVLKSKDGHIGTATLIAPDLIVSAAHVIKNSQSDPMPQGGDWEFILSPDFEEASESQIHRIAGFVIHPVWLSRQEQGIKSGIGDGDRIGVDLCLGFLENQILGVYPTALPHDHPASLGQRAVIAGFGTAVEGATGSSNTQNSRRLAGENLIDRIVEQVPISSISESDWGGLLAVDFDSPNLDKNFLGSEYPPIDYLGNGTSDANPLPMEISTANGDSGGPIFVLSGGLWRINGVVSYGTNYSLYGDVTVFTRLTSHQDWIGNYLPPWAEAKVSDEGKWRELRWFGAFLPYDEGWNFHSRLGWFFNSGQEGSDFWIWQENLGWLWSSPSAYPFVYADEKKHWIFLNLEMTNPSEWSYYDYHLDSWMRTSRSL